MTTNKKSKPHHKSSKSVNERKRRHPFKTALKTILLLFVLLVLLAGGAIGYGFWWSQQPLELLSSKVEFTVPPGASMRTAAVAAARHGVLESELLLENFFRFASNGRTIKPGDYLVTAGMTPDDLLRKLIRGDRIVLTITFIEGWNFKQARAAIEQATGLRHETVQMSNEQIMTALGHSGVSPEGRFFPDTFHYFRSANDMDIWRQSFRAMENHLAAAWAARAPDLPLKSPADALILASLIEKETGHSEDRTQIAGVFVNRLRKGMLLQTDPSVIYGMGDSYTGTLRRTDLKVDTPWNTYTRHGLPPTPIALPGQASLLAAVQPATTDALYFVARGDGSSKFSETLDEHNRAVNQYLRSGTK
jgi:UPF0755 protein